MSKTKLVVFLGAALVVGLIAGFGVATATRPTARGSAASQIQNARLQVGDAAPDFRLPDHAGGYVRLSDFRGKKNVVIAFYPAAFTPV